MIIKLTTRDLQQFAEELKEWHRDWFPDDPDGQVGIYLTKPDVLYVDEDLNRDIIGELDKLVCKFEGDHEVHKKLMLAWRVRNAWGVRIDDV